MLVSVLLKYATWNKLFNHRHCPGWKLSICRLNRENFSFVECQSFFLGVSRNTIVKTKCYLIIQTHKNIILTKAISTDSA